MFNFKRNIFLSLFIIGLLLLVACSSEGESNKEEEETNDNTMGSISIGTHASGSGYHTVGAGFAKLITEHSSIRGNVSPSAGPQAWMSEVNAGELEFGLISSFDLTFAWRGGNGYDKPNENIRTVFGGMPMHQSIYGVQEDSDIKSLSDLKGKAISAEFGGNAAMASVAEASLLSVGLTWDDVKAVPVPEFMAGLDALQNGTVDATIPASPTAAKAIEVANAIGGIRVLPFGDLKPEDIENGVPEEMQKLLDDYVPSATFETLPAGTGILSEDTVHIRFEMNLISNTDVSDETVYEVLKAIWENAAEVHDLINYTSTLGPENMLVENPSAPYHDGAIKFYKEVGVWTDELERKQEELLNME